MNALGKLQRVTRGQAGVGREGHETRFPGAWKRTPRARMEPSREQSCGRNPRGRGPSRPTPAGPRAGPRSMHTWIVRELSRLAFPGHDL